VFRHPTGDAAIDRQANFVLVKAKSDERPDFVALAVHQKHRAAFGAGVPRSELQDNVEQFGEVERGIQPLGGFHNRGKLNYCMAPFAAFQRHLCVTPEELQPAARLGIERSLGPRFQNSHWIRAVPQHPRAAVTVRCQFLALQNSLDARRVRHG